MFEFDVEKPSKVVATSTIQIVPDRGCDPPIWTPGLRAFYSRRVFIVCSVDWFNRRAMRFYPLQDQPGKPIPAFVIVEKESPLLNEFATHVCYEHEWFKIIRPLRTIYYRAKETLRRGDIIHLPANLRTLARHLHRYEVINDELLHEVETETDKAYQITESHAIRAYRWCERLFELLEKEVKPYV